MVKETHVTLSLPKGMKQTEIGLIPEDWEVKKLGSLAFITKLAGFEYSKHFNSYKDGGEIIVVRGTNITKNKLDLTETKYIPRKISDFLYRSKLSKGDLVFAYVGTIGPIYLVNENDRFHLGPNTAKIRIEDKNTDVNFIHNYFLSEFIRKEIDDRISVGAQPSLSMFKIRDFSIPLPPLAEQEAIAAALSDCDVWIESLEAVIAKKRLIKQGAMQKLLTPKEDWEVKKLGEVADIIGGGTPSTFVSKYWNGNIEWFTPTEVGYSKYLSSSRRKISYLGFKNASANLLPKNSILLTSRAGIGDLGILKIEACTNQGFQSIVCKENIDFEFIYYLMSTKKDDLLRNASGSTFLEISPNKVKSLEIEIPSLSEQTRIATVLSDMDAELEALGQKLNKARQIKQGMMQELLTGRVRLIV